jgi:hypothetical protein
MAEHYDTAVVPARVRRPKDKPGVEGTVGNVSSTWIIAAFGTGSFSPWRNSIKPFTNCWMSSTACHFRKKRQQT